MRLTGIHSVGRFKNKETGRSYNIRNGRNMQRSTDDNYFYTYRGKRVFISPRTLNNNYILELS